MAELIRIREKTTSTYINLTQFIITHDRKTQTYKLEVPDYDTNGLIHVATLYEIKKKKTPSNYNKITAYLKKHHKTSTQDIIVSDRISLESSASD